MTGHKGEASVTIDETIDNVSPSDFDALLLPGRPIPGFPARGRALRDLHPGFCLYRQTGLCYLPRPAAAHQRRRGPRA